MAFNYFVFLVFMLFMSIAINIVALNAYSLLC